MKKVLSVGVLALTTGLLPASTLQQLSLTDMTLKSTAIVRGRLTFASMALRGDIIYTHYSLTVTEVWKGVAAAQIDVAVPGGYANGAHQTFAGAPAFVNGQDYLLFLWTSKTGLTQVIGLSQGIFTLIPNAPGSASDPLAVRVAISEPMVNSSGVITTSGSFQMLLSALRAQVQTTLGSAK